MAIPGVTDDRFKEILKRHFTPGRAISSTEYLRGRETKLRQIERAFNSDGKHIFVHGDRGVGKTSLARTAAFIHTGSERDPVTIECEPLMSAYQLLRDIAVSCVPPESQLHSATTKKTFKAGLPGLSGEVVEEIKRGEIPPITSINQALAIIGLLVSTAQRPPVVIIDEFDVIRDPDTRHTFASFVKHISDQEIPLRFIVCGIGDSLDEMIGAHQSTGRYLMPIPLERLPHDARWDIVRSAADGLGVHLDENSMVRIGQVSDGFPYYVHLIGEQMFWAVFDDERPITQTLPEHFEIALREACIEAEPSLKAAYDRATQKYTNDYQQVLWAVADHSSLRRQMKDIYDSYRRLMTRHAPGKEELERSTFYNRMNALKGQRHGEILRTTSPGWYEFRENRLRGYVRLVAEREGVLLEPEHPLGAKKHNALREFLTREEHR